MPTSSAMARSRSRDRTADPDRCTTRTSFVERQDRAHDDRLGARIHQRRARRNRYARAVWNRGKSGRSRARCRSSAPPNHGRRSPLHGELHANTEQLALISLYVPEIDRASGHLDADLRIAGTVGAPFMNGDLRISKGEIDYYQVNLGMRQVTFDARLTDSGVDFKGNARIGSGMAEARGQLEWKNSLPYGKVRIEGSNLRVVDVPEAHIEASPELTFNVNGRRIEVAGTVRVPEAKIVPKDLSGAVRSSSDAVIVGQQETDPSKRFEVVSAITLALGDHVSIDTTGLTGRLTGNITVRSGYDSITSATGELSIEQGKYTAYARKLDIQRGRLIFTGGPVANPGIDIRAIKEFPDVKAGVNVRGTLLQPRMSFFSDPSLTQAQIVSLILAGGSLETAQGRQAGAGSEAPGAGRRDPRAAARLEGRDRRCQPRIRPDERNLARAGTVFVAPAVCQLRDRAHGAAQCAQASLQPRQSLDGQDGSRAGQRGGSRVHDRAVSHLRSS